MTNQVVCDLVDEWSALRIVLREAEAAEHPDVTDKFGRAWTWISGDLYRHCQLAWPLVFITSEKTGLPRPQLRDNPNYSLCVICTQEW